MQVFTRTLSNVFNGDRRYVIPPFQRSYVWSEEYQWAPLWDDILGKAERELVAGEDETPPHFLGAVVLQQRRSWGDEILSHDVIDGQQRLTTFQLLLAALRDITSAKGDRVVAPWVASLTNNANAIANPDQEKYKVWPTNRDLAQFTQVMTAGSRESLELRHPAIYKRRRLVPRPRMVEAYLYFHGVLAGWLEQGGDDKVTERCKALRRVLDKRMQLVSIELDGGEDPQLIFETLNARGVPLLASDLIRNYVFQRAGGPEVAEKLHTSYWGRFDSPDDPTRPDGPRFWEVEERQGRLSRARLDLLVQHYLSMKLVREVGSTRLYPEYKGWIEQSKPFNAVEAELKELTRFADHFLKLLRPDTKTALGRFAGRLKILDISTAYPLVLAIVANSELPEGDREAIYNALESFLIRRLVCGRTTKNYNRLFLQLLRDFGEKPERTAASFTQLLAAGTGEAVDWPDDAAFEKAWLTLDAYRDLKPARVEMILLAIEAAKRDAKAESITIDGRLTIEHVLPQSWKKHWPLPAGDEQTTSQAREEVLHDFGNLTLLTSALNESVSNGPAAGKLPEIAKQSTLRLNAYFQGRTTWNESDIATRGAELFGVAKRVWAHP